MTETKYIQHEGTLTDFEGTTARIDDKSVTMTKPAAEWCAKRLRKGMVVEFEVFTEGEDHGKIRRIWEKKGAAFVPLSIPAAVPRGPGDLGCVGCSPNDKDSDCDFCRSLQEGSESKEVATIVPAQVVPHIAAPAPIPKTYSPDEMSLLRHVIAKGCTEPEFKLLMYMAGTYGLDPLLKQIWAVKRNERDDAIIFAGRDGMLAIAHRSGAFDGMQSGVVYEGEGKDRKPKSAWCEVWRKDMSHSFKTEVPFAEYNTGYSVWKSNPSAMILKVAESVCLRKAFSVSGLYDPSEVDMGVQ